jgi:hypothetical protein
MANTLLLQGVDPGPDIVTFPALFGPIIPIIVVGAAEIDGTLADYSQGGTEDVAVLAPGEITCAKGVGDQDMVTTGTSNGKPP